MNARHIPIRSLFALLLPLTVLAQSAKPNPKAVERLRADVYVLADDAMEGRKVGTRGEQHAAAYLSGRMAS
ncbi:MAG: hypothetical protein RL157_464, partial [Bacteroidota bacterium]